MANVKRLKGGATRATPGLAPDLLFPRKQPLQQRSIAMVDAMLEASTRILAEAGPSAMTTNAVAELAGVSVGSLYQYFPNRDAILVALMERFERRMQSRMEAALAQGGHSVRAGLAVLVQTALAHHVGQRALVAILEAEEKRLGSAAQQVLVSADSQLTEFISAFVRAHSAQQTKEVGRVVSRMKVVGQALVDDAARRFDQDPRLTDEIVSVIIACAPKGFWKTDVG